VLLIMSTPQQQAASVSQPQPLKQPCVGRHVDQVKIYWRSAPAACKSTRRRRHTSVMRLMGDLSPPSECYTNELLAPPRPRCRKTDPRKLDVSARFPGSQIPHIPRQPPHSHRCVAVRYGAVRYGAIPQRNATHRI